ARKGLAMVFVERRLVFPKVHVRGSAWAEDLQHPLRLRPEVGKRRLRGKTTCREVAKQQLAKPHSSESRGDRAKKRPAREADQVGRGICRIGGCFNRHKQTRWR